MEVEDLKGRVFSDAEMKKEFLRVLLEIRDCLSLMSELVDAAQGAEANLCDIAMWIDQIGFKLKEGIVTFPQSE